MIRWLKFNSVGIVGAGVQLVALKLLLAVGLSYLPATALAVETAVLHNYFWHVRWTWKERSASAGLATFLRFHLANGMVSLISNLALMRILVGWMGLPTLPANALAICATSIVNFALGHRWVFRED